MVDNFATVRSSVAGMAWPGLPGGAGSTLLALQFQLGQSQWWSPAELARHQLSQASLCVRQAIETVPFHRARLLAAGHRAWEELTPEAFARLPRMTRADIQSAGDGMFSENVPAAHGAQVSGGTSGSTGRPIAHRGTELTQLFWHAFTLRDHLWHGRDFAAKLGAIRQKAGLGVCVSPGWGPPAELAFHTGPLATCDLAVDVDGQLDWLERERPAYLITPAHNLYWLARRSLERGFSIPGLRQVRSYGGVLPEDARPAVRAAWGAALVDMYTAEEVGYIALQCPLHEHYHVQSENAIVEILDEKGAACAPGQTGKVVITTLHNFAMPLIRYELGDYAEAGSPCPCGRGLPVINRILGRQRNILTLPDGRRRWPSFSSRHWAHVAPVRQLQLVQRTPVHIDIRVVPARALTEGEKAGLISALRDCLGDAFDMTVTEVAEIPRAASHKFEDFVSEVVR